MTTNDGYPQNNIEPNFTFSAAELALIGGLVTTLGDLISTYSAVLALEEERQDNNDSKNIQSQIDYLLHEVKELKKQVYHDRSRRF